MDTCSSRKDGIPGTHPEQTRWKFRFKTCAQVKKDGKMGIFCRKVPKRSKKEFEKVGTFPSGRKKMNLRRAQVKQMRLLIRHVPSEANGILDLVPGPHLSFSRRWPVFLESTK
jgi:hypothetical protein